MSAYVYGMICASLAIGFAELLIPESAKTRPYLKLIFGLALLLVIVKPIGELVDFLPTVGDRIFSEELEADEYENIAEGQLAEAYRKGITANLEAEFGLKSFEVGVLMGEGRKPKRVTVTLMGVDIFRNTYKIEEYVSSAFGCECITIIGGGDPI